MLTVLAWLGFFWMVFRLWPRAMNDKLSQIRPGEPLISIIIPARNEEFNLPCLLKSIKASQYRNFEVIVVDDHSDDGTRDIASRAGATVIQASERPADWVAKQWVCKEGAHHARGEYLFFLDADTEIFPDTLERALNFIENNRSEERQVG